MKDKLFWLATAAVVGIGAFSLYGSLRASWRCEELGGVQVQQFPTGFACVDAGAVLHRGFGR